MKKVKIMLLSLALFAVVGGALAFKAKFTSNYCVTLPDYDASGNPSCRANGDACQLFEKVTTHINIGSVLCTTPKPALGCAATTVCSTLNKIKSDQ